MFSAIRPQQLPIGGTVGVAAVALAALGLLTAFLLADAQHPIFQAPDDAWTAWIADARSPSLDAVNQVLNVAGYRGVLLLQATLTLLLFVRHRPADALFSLASGGLVLLLTQVLKAAVGRVRPPNTVVLTDTGSFPSGHTATTTAFLLLLALLIARWWMWLLALVLSLAMAISRIYLQAHWATDTLGGILLAVTVVPALWLAFQKDARRGRVEGRRETT